MAATTRESAPVVIGSDGVRLAGAEIGGDLTVGWAPGHAPMALEDYEYVDFSPSSEPAPVVAHLTGTP